MGAVQNNVTNVRSVFTQEIICYSTCSGNVSAALPLKRGDS